MQSHADLHTLETSEICTIAHFAMIQPPVRLGKGFVITEHVFRLILMEFALPRP